MLVGDTASDDTDIQDEGGIQPVHSIDLENEEEVLDFTKQALEILSQGGAVDRREWQRLNLCRYKGYYSKYEPVIGSRNTQAGAIPRQKWPRIVVNHTRDLIDQGVAKIMKIRPQTQFVPNNGEYKDKISAQTAKKVVESIRNRYDYESMLTRSVRRAKIFGESFVQVHWNKNLGELTPEGKKLLKEHQEGKGPTVENKDGKKITARIFPKKGEVEIKLLDNDMVYVIPGPTTDPKDCPGVFILEYKHVFDVRAEYPELEDQIEPETTISYFDLNTLEESRLQDHCIIIHAWFRSSPLLPNGCYYKCLPNLMLEEPMDNPIPYTREMECSDFGNLPIERLTEIDLEGYLHGWSGMADLNILQEQYDKITSLISRNIFLFCHPKWMVPRGGCNFEQLGNGSFIVAYNGPVQPQLASYNAITSEVFSYWQALEQSMQKISGIYAHSRGEAPTGTRAASQLMIYDEQEEEHRSTFRKKLERLAVSIDAKILAIASKEYQGEEERLMYVVGEHKEWIAEPFKLADLQKDYVVRILPSNALPENKAARIQTLLQINRYIPGLYSKEQLADAIDFGQHEKYIDYVQTAIVAAEAENELLMKGEDVEPPELYEDLINHWRIHAKMLQKRYFKQIPEEDQKRALDHVGGTEALMFIQGNQNPAFKQQIMMLSTFPLVYKMPPPMPVPMGAPPPPQGPPIPEEMPPGPMPGMNGGAGKSQGGPAGPGGGFE